MGQDQTNDQIQPPFLPLPPGWQAPQVRPSGPTSPSNRGIYATSGPSGGEKVLDSLRSSPALVLAAAIIIAALLLGGVMLKISNNDRCRPIAVERTSQVLYGDGEVTSESLETPPGC